LERHAYFSTFTMIKLFDLKKKEAAKQGGAASGSGPKMAPGLIRMQKGECRGLNPAASPRRTQLWDGSSVARRASLPPRHASRGYPHTPMRPARAPRLGFTGFLSLTAAPAARLRSTRKPPTPPRPWRTPQT